MKQGQLIGFANTFYTLWDYRVETNYVTDSYGQHHASSNTTHYFFRKNVSTDLDKVKRLHPDLSIDDSLRGKNSSWDSVGRVELPNDIFWFGKYYGRKVDEILTSDMGYCEWVVRDNCYNQVQYIIAHPIYIEHIAKIEAERQATLNAMNPLKVGDEVELEFISNGFLTMKKHPNEANMTSDEYYAWEVSDEGKQCVAKATKDGSDIVFYVSVPDYKRVNGRFPYIMPSINGKCQKTKGKRFVVKVYEVSEPYINRWNYIEQSIKIA
jgi:hypothetical protein